MNKPITMMELEEFMSHKTGVFDAKVEGIDKILEIVEE